MTGQKCTEKNSVLLLSAGLLARVHKKSTRSKPALGKEAARKGNNPSPHSVKRRAKDGDCSGIYYSTHILNLLGLQTTY